VTAGTIDIDVADVKPLQAVAKKFFTATGRVSMPIQRSVRFPSARRHLSVLYVPDGSIKRAQPSPKEALVGEMLERVVDRRTLLVIDALDDVERGWRYCVAGRIIVSFLAAPGRVARYFSADSTI
jgi:hypothetical protein